MAKKIRENGIVLSKFIRPATEQFVINDRVIPEKPERPTVVVACGEVNGNDGIEDMTIVTFVVEKELYDRLKYMDEVEAAYEYNGDGKTKPVELNLI